MQSSKDGSDEARPGAIARLRRLAADPHPALARDPDAYRLLVDSLFSSPTSFFLSNLVGVLVPTFCWYTSGEPVFSWLGLVALAMAAMRLTTLVGYRRLRGRPMDGRHVWIWDREYFVGATSFSLLLGAICFVAVARTENVPCQLMTVGSSIAFAAGYVARNAGRPIFVIIQLVAFCGPTAAGLALAHDPAFHVIAGYIVLYGFTNVSIVFSLNRNLLQLAAATRQSGQLATSLKTKNATLDTALNSMTHGLCMFSQELAVEVANLRFRELYGLTAADVAPGTPLAKVIEAIVRAQTLTPQSARDLTDLCLRVVELAAPAESETMAEGGQIFVVSVDVTEGGGILMLTEDASARKAAAAQIERMAHCDTLTGLPNRFRFNEVLRAALDQVGGRRLGLLYVDLDDFKGVNDTMGHEAGDQLLVTVAERLQGLMQRVGGLVGRFGGDEFLILLDGDGDRALGLGREVIERLAQPLEIDGKTLSITTSVGVAIGPVDGREPSELLRAADMALYAAKAAGRNTAVPYSRELAEQLSHRRDMELDLREAARSGRLSLYYQPIVDARTDQVRCYEALMRWLHPEKGMISPVEFIPIAEQTGLIVQMGAWALRQACLDARSWPDRVSIAVNVSAFQFKNPAQLIEAVKDALLISGLDPTRLELEVTESLLIADQDATLEAIRTLRRLGVRFSLDDFGSGYSSLGYLARYPFSKVKIDRSFAEHLTSDSSSRSIIEVVCQLAGKLGMRVVVEGIETEAQRREIVALGAEQAQGFLFGRPQPLALLRPDQQEAA